MLTLSLLSAVGLTSSAAAQESKAKKPLAGYNVLAVEKASVEQNAATENFPGGYDVVLQKSTIDNLQKKKVFAQIIDASENASAGSEGQAPSTDDKRLILSMTVIKFDKGSRAARYFGGFGAGATKIKVRFVFRDAASGQEVFRTDREGKFYGTFSLFGGAKERAISEAAGDVVDGVIKDISKNR
jgi:hypothetical protein